MSVKPKLRKHVKFRNEGSWALISDGNTRTAYKTNLVGYSILKMLDGFNSIDKIVESVAQSFSRDRSETEDDVIFFLKELDNQGLIDPPEVTKNIKQSMI